MRTLSTMVMAVVVAAVVLASSSPAAAVESDGVDEVCTVGTVASEAGAALSVDVPLVVSCFASAEEATAFIEAGAPGDREKLLADFSSLLPQARFAPLGTVHLGTTWTGINRTGSSLMYWGTGSGCYGATYGFPSLPSGWGAAMRSAEGENNCFVTLYTSGSYGGSALNCTPYCGGIGSWAGSVGSMVFRPWGTYG